MEITDITTTNWQLGINGFGDIALDGDDLDLCIHNILFTRKGEVPLDPEFGSDLYKLIDLPVQKLIPAIIAEVTDAIKTYEPRVDIDNITTSVSDDGSGVTFYLNMKAKGPQQTPPYVFKVNNLISAQGRSFSDGFSKDFM
jgi:phage baseplate assembly protein W